MSYRTNLRWSIVGGVLTLNTRTSTEDEIKVVAFQKPLMVTLDEEGLDSATEHDITNELFGTDDGFNTQRDSLLKYRVAYQALLSIPGRDATIRSNGLEANALRIEHEMNGVFELMTYDTPVINEVKVVDVDT